MDDAGTAAALPALGHFRHRQRAACKAAGRAVVSALAVRPLARCQRAVAGSTPLASQPCHAGNCGDIAALIRCSLGRKQTMRWKISHHGHDPRQIDLLAALALLVVIVAAYLYFTHHPQPPDTAAFIVPSQSVRW